VTDSRRFEGKTVLITGGASGIGKASAAAFAAEGGYVVIADLDETSGQKVAVDLGGLFVRTDVTDPEQMQACVDAARERSGRVDIAYLNAGITTGESDVTKVGLEAYRRIMAINIDGVFFGLRAVVPTMTEGGAVIATASLAGISDYGGDPIYSVTKHAVVGLVRSSSEQLKERGVTINAVCPGFTETPMIGDYVEGFRAANFPLLTPDEVATAVLGVALSEHTGQVFVVQPGRTLEPYRFRGVPGPRVEGTDAVAPPPRL
jgi:NAD(P)-dependent dehydrogenase (short-subunit alcohol dehydrogenase family)